VRDTQKERHGNRERQTERKRVTDWDINIERDRHAYRQRDRQIKRQTDKETDR
jgi:hypothetical protein